MKKTLILSSMLAVALCLSCTNDNNDFLENEINTEEIANKRLQPIPVITQVQGACGVTEGNDHMPVSESQMNQLMNNFSPLPPINVLVKYHIVRKSNGTDGIPVSDIDQMNNKLNQNFSQALYGCVQFPIGPERLNFIKDDSVDYIDSDKYYIIDDSNRDEFNELTTMYNEEGKLNIFIVKQFEPSRILGRGKLRGNSSVISRYNNAHLGNTPAHEVGHNFGLNHLSYNSNRLLCDDEIQNCSSTTGDLIADTPISTSGLVSLVTQNCELKTDGTAVYQICEDGTRVKMNKFDILFSAKNIMRTATEDGCRIGFTGMQHIQMNQMAIDLGIGNE